MKLVTSLILFALCLNISCGLVKELTFPSSNMVRFWSDPAVRVENNTAWTQSHNYTAFIENMTKTNIPDVTSQSPTWLQSLSALSGVLKWISYLLVGFPILLGSLGVPGPIVVALGLIIGFFVGLFLLELFTGRDMIGE